MDVEPVGHGPEGRPGYALEVGIHGEFGLRSGDRGQNRCAS
jgi:hypothetical protein